VRFYYRVCCAHIPSPFFKGPAGGSDGNILSCTGRVQQSPKKRVSRSVLQLPTVLSGTSVATVPPLGQYNEAQSGPPILWSAPLAFSLAGVEPLVAPLVVVGSLQTACWEAVPWHPGLPGLPNQAYPVGMAHCFCSDDLNRLLPATGSFAPIGSAVETAVSQYAAAAARAENPIAAASNQQYIVPQNVQSPAPSPRQAAGPYIGVYGGSGQLPPVATVPATSDPRFVVQSPPLAVQPVGPAPQSPTMIGTMSTVLGGPMFEGSVPTTAAQAAPGIQILGTGYVPQYTQVPMVPMVAQGYAQMATPAFPLTTLVPPGAGVADTIAVPPGVAPAAAVHVVPQGSPLAGGTLFGGVHRNLGAQGVALPDDVAVGPSPTPIADSVLLGHMLGDEAAPPPNKPLPVVTPLPETSGITMEEVRLPSCLIVSRF
jgi:hypothetical protein